MVRAKDVTARAPSKNVNSWALTVETAGLDSVRLLRFRSDSVADERAGLEMRGGGGDEKSLLRMSIRFYDLYCVGSCAQTPLTDRRS